MKQVKMHSTTDKSLINIVNRRKEKEPHKSWNKQTVIADLVDKAEKKECK